MLNFAIVVESSSNYKRYQLRKMQKVQILLILCRLIATFSYKFILQFAYSSQVPPQTWL